MRRIVDCFCIAASVFFMVVYAAGDTLYAWNVIKQVVPSQWLHQPVDFGTIYLIVVTLVLTFFTFK